jgi:hypothetical protein
MEENTNYSRAISPEICLKIAVSYESYRFLV